MNQEQPQNNDPVVEAPGAVNLRNEAAENNGIIEDLQAVAEEHGKYSDEDKEVLDKWRKEDVAKKLDEAEEKNQQRKEILALHAGEVADKAVIHTDKFGNVLTDSEVKDILSGNQAVKK
jgi:hypothetical protein